MYRSINYLVIAFSIIRWSNGYVFTDVKHDYLMLKMHGDSFDHNNVDPTDANHNMTLVKFGLIYPGTKWCGPGNIADNFDDLGYEAETDSCCRAHDNCPDVISGGEHKNNLTNEAFYSRLSCDCDETFRSCLHNVNSGVGNQIGYIYFNVLGTQCYREDYPTTGCKRYGISWFKRKCVKYSYDKESEKLNQWFDVPDY